MHLVRLTKALAADLRSRSRSRHQRRDERAPVDSPPSGAGGGGGPLHLVGWDPGHARDCECPHCRALQAARAEEAARTRSLPTPRRARQALEIQAEQSLRAAEREREAQERAAAEGASAEGVEDW